MKTPLGAGGPREAERYLREAGILQRLREVSGIIRLHAHVPGPERPLLLLEEVEGGALSELKGQPLEVARVLELGCCLAGLHRRGVIHKDLKPSNHRGHPGLHVSGADRATDIYSLGITSMNC